MYLEMDEKKKTVELNLHVTVGLDHSLLKSMDDALAKLVTDGNIFIY